ncbi:MAG TPA: DUF58 domain-containing protein [Acidimicrobiia bacterium]|nr:DUF58 domain-containing protein [Acidimicrobiia bacterium]
MTLTARGWTYLVVAVFGPFASLLLGDPAPALIALPAMLISVFGIRAGAGSNPRLEVGLSTDQTLEGEPVTMTITVHDHARWAHLLPGLPAEIEMSSVTGARAVPGGLVVPVDGSGTATLEIVARRWGTYRLGEMDMTGFGPLGVVARSFSFSSAETLVVLPGVEKARLLVEPISTNLHGGDLVSAQRGRGSALAELRPWSPGDSPRSINWRATLRSDQTWVTARHADRSGDLVLVIDSVLELGSDVEPAVTRAVRIAAALVEAYGHGRHRLGLVSLGGYTRWFGLDSGRVHEHRLLAAAMATQATPEPVWMAVDRILDHTVRPPSMVVFVSPLLDDALIGRIHRLARARIDVAVVAIEVDSWLRSPSDHPRRLARRIWHLEREAVVDRLRQAGVAVVEWRPHRPLDELMREMEEWRRRLRRARV